ncbi:arginine N-succinyltransferase [Massilia sp. W12]|uniref:arginine N-succinyltransferase n=1 Tax=Massilia sp. W12 TaxID=3126507 RepID=UPI0030D2DCEA
MSASYVVRPVALDDIPALEALARQAARGVHTLPRTPENLLRAVRRSIASFAAQVEIPSEESYMFVLQDAAGGVAGCATIFATAGSNGTYFAFRNDVVQQVSRDLNISHNVHALSLCSELTACSQLSSFFIHPQAQTEAALLSRARLLFAAMAPQRFGDRFFVSLAGVSDANGQSPFWDALGRKFFQMDFLDAEHAVEGARNRTLIVELMPHYPVYVPLLPAAAQAVLGQSHPEAELPFSLLSAEGFAADEYIDIFDGGPILQAHRDSLRTVQQARRYQVAAGQADAEAADWLVGSVRQADFRAAHLRAALRDDVLLLDAAQMAALRVQAGDEVLCVPA